MPVFNKAALTKQCLETIRPTLRGAGEGEILVIDNASSDETQEMLREFPWVTVVRNEVNLGFSGANNQGARMAQGEYLVLLNNDTVARPGWLAAMLARAREPGVGIVGAKLLFPNGTIQHAGVVTMPFRFGSAGFGAFHDLYNLPANHPATNARADFQVLTGACMVTPRALYLELGGLDEGFWNGYEDVDYCFKVGARGLRAVYEPAAVLTHFESQSGPQRFRKVSWNVARLTGRWNDAIVFDANVHRIARGAIRREVRLSQRVHTFDALAIPQTTIVLHGPVELPQPAALLENNSPVARVVRASDADAVAAIRETMEIRGDRYLAVVDARATLHRGWLDELVRQIEFSSNVGAATYAPELRIGEDVNPLAADARCTLLALRQFPQHLRVADLPSANGAIADLLLRALGERVATRGVGSALGELPALEPDAEFERLHGMPLRDVHVTDAARIEPFVTPPAAGEAPLVSVLMLSWNAPEYTRLALESIRAHTRMPYEVVIVDNGSGPETTSWLRTLDDVRIIYNPTNRGFAGGSNQAIAAAKGEYVVLLNNDTIVTEGWLEGLLDAFERVPALGVSAVRSNRVAGVQMVYDVPYKDIDGMHAFAAGRRRLFRKQGFVIDRAIGLCLCISRRVIEEVGGIDERFGVGNFEDDDFCLRVRAAGYRIYVCDDVFIHHFGSQTFAANKIDYRATMSENWDKFASKWSLEKLPGVDGYDARPAYRRGFERARHFVPLPEASVAVAAPVASAERAYETIFAAIVRDESDWHEVGAFVRRYGQAFDDTDPTLVAIAALDGSDATTLGERIRRAFEKQGLTEAASPDVVVSDEIDVAVWLAGLPAGTRIAIGSSGELAAYPQPSEQSPSALRRAYAGEKKR